MDAHSSPAGLTPRRGSSWVDSADRTAYNCHGASRSLSETTERLAQYRTQDVLSTMRHPPGWHRHDDSHLKASLSAGLLLCTQVAYFASHVRPLQHHNRARSASAPVPAPRGSAQPPAALQPRTDPGRARGPAARRRARASYAALGAGSLLVEGAWILGNRQAIRFASSSGLSIQATDQSPASARSRHTTLPG